MRYFTPIAAGDTPQGDSTSSAARPSFFLWLDERCSHDRWARLFTLEDQQLVPEEQDFDVLVSLSVTPEPDEVEQC